LYGEQQIGFVPQKVGFEFEVRMGRRAPSRRRQHESYNAVTPTTQGLVYVVNPALQ